MKIKKINFLPKSIFLPMLVGLVCAGLLTSTLYAMAAAQFNPGDTTNPTCLPTDPSCTVTPPLTNGFANYFSSATITNNGSQNSVNTNGGNISTYGDYVSFGNFHNRTTNSKYFFGPADNA